MLADTYDSSNRESVNGWLMSIKYDGVRGKWNGEEMESRTKHIYNIPEFLKNQLRKFVDKDAYPLILDGEIWAGNNTFTDFVGLVKRKVCNPDLWKGINYVIFDNINTDKTFMERFDEVIEIYNNLEDKTGILLADYRLITKDTDIENELKIIEDSGGEGMILRNPKSYYRFKRSKDVLKVKSWLYNEGILVGYEEGTGKYEKMVGTLIVETTELSKNGKVKTIKLGSGLNDIQRYTGLKKGEEWKESIIDKNRMKLQTKLDNDKEHVPTLIPGISFNNIITFRYKGLTKYGVPSFPTFVSVRIDKE